MEKYRAKQQRSWSELTARLRQLRSGKGPFVENEERNQLLRCLGTLQKTIKIKSAQNMIERLDNITRQLGLKLTKDRKRFTDSQAIEFEVFISSDMFYVEVMIEPNGRVCDVKIAHHGDPVRCLELCSVLQASDFATFRAHLEGLISIYKLNCDKSTKQKAYVALQLLEKKLTLMANAQSDVADLNELLFKSPVGLLIPRRGGFPLQLTFFISPYDFINHETGERLPFTVDGVSRHKLGTSVSISIDAFEQQSKNDPTKAKSNFPIPDASYVMMLSTRLAVDVECVERIRLVTGLDVYVNQSPEPLVRLVTGRDYSEAFHVKLPDQSHTYFINDGARLGVMLEVIPFTSSKQIPAVLELLRHQCFFNCLMMSCVRDFEPEPDDLCHVFEVIPTGLNTLCVSFEHPLDCESLMAVELCFTNIVTEPSCKSLFRNEKTKPFISDEHVAAALRMSFSIPVVMRTILNKANCEHEYRDTLLKNTLLKNTLLTNTLLTNTLTSAVNCSSIVFDDAVTIELNQNSSFYDAASVQDNRTADLLSQKLLDLEDLCQQRHLDLEALAANSGPNVDTSHCFKQQDLNQLAGLVVPAAAAAAAANEQESFSLVDDNVLFNQSVFADSRTSESLAQERFAEAHRPDVFNSNRNRPPQASDVVTGNFSVMANVLDSNQKNLLTGGDSTESSPLTIHTATLAAAARTASMKPIDDRKESKPSSKSKKSSSSHGRKKERSSSKDRSSTRSSSKGSSSKLSSSKERKRNSGGDSSSRSSTLAPAFDGCHLSSKTDSALASKESSSFEKQFTVRQTSSAQGMKLTINKARPAEGDSRNCSSKHHRSSSKPKSQLSVSSCQVKQSSSSCKASPKPHQSLSVIPLLDDENDAMDLVEEKLRALHSDEASINHFAGSRSSSSDAGVASRSFDDAFLE